MQQYGVNGYPQTYNGWNNYGAMNNTVQQVPVEQKGITNVVVVSNRNDIDHCLAAAGQTTAILNFNDGEMYLKATDPYGTPMPLRVFSIREITEEIQKTSQPNQMSIQNQNDSVSKQDFEELKAMVTKLVKDLG